MKKILMLLLTLTLVFTMVACGGEAKTSDTKNEKSNSSSDESKKDNKKDDKKDDKKDAEITDEDIKKAEKALESLGKSLGNGWKDGNYYQVRYNEWDTEVLPKVLPAPMAGFQTEETRFKDYNYPVLSDWDKRLGEVRWEDASDFSLYSVLFHDNDNEFDAYLDAIKANGFIGGDCSNDIDDNKNYCFSHPDGWLMYIYYYSDGDASIHLTSDVFKSPASIAGMSLPDKGVPTKDLKTKGTYTAWDLDSYDKVELPIDWNGSFPDNNKYEWYTTLVYEGVNPEYVWEYSERLAAEGWEYFPDEDNEKDDYFSNYLRKDGVILVIKCDATIMAINIGSNYDLLCNY